MEGNFTRFFVHMSADVSYIARHVGMGRVTIYSRSKNHETHCRSRIRFWCASMHIDAEGKYIATHVGIVEAGNNILWFENS